MFFSPIKTEPIPERVPSISQIVANKGSIDEKELESILVPSKLSTAKALTSVLFLKQPRNLSLLDITKRKKLYLPKKKKISNH